MDIRKLIADVQKANGTEVHLKIGSKPLMRKNKFLRKIDAPVIQEEDMVGVIKELLKPIFSVSRPVISD
jgi:Tfp pilus assembly pilus retraction ATPase PilT